MDHHDPLKPLAVGFALLSVSALDMFLASLLLLLAFPC